MEDTVEVSQAGSHLQCVSSARCPLLPHTGGGPGRKLPSTWRHMTTGYSHMCMERVEKWHFQVRHENSPAL